MAQRGFDVPRGRVGGRRYAQPERSLGDEMPLFVAGSVAVVAALVWAAWRFLESRRQSAWRDHEDEMMNEITEQRIRRNFMQGGG